MKQTVRPRITSVCSCVLVVLSCNIAAADLAELIARAEATPRPNFDKTKEVRVKRIGNEVIDLNLDHVQLRPGDVEELVKCKTLERLSLAYTNVTDDQLKLLIGSERLRGLRLNHTAIGDAGVKHLGKIKSLKSLCLGGADVSREAVKLLRKARPDMGLGYFPKTEK